MSGYPVVTSGDGFVASPSERPATVTQTHIVDLTTTRQRVTFPSGAKWVHVLFADIGTTAVNAQFMRLVAGTKQMPLSEAEADGRLSVTGAHIAVPYGVPLTLTFADENLCTSIDVVAAVAVGAGKNIVTIIGGL